MQNECAIGSQAEGGGGESEGAPRLQDSAVRRHERLAVALAPRPLRREQLVRRLGRQRQRDGAVRLRLEGARRALAGSLASIWPLVSTFSLARCRLFVVLLWLACNLFYASTCAGGGG